MPLFSIKFICIFLLPLLASGCTIPMKVDNLKPAEALPPTETVSGNYAASISGTSGRTVVLNVREPGSYLDHRVLVTAPYGDVLTATLEADIKTYAGGSRIIPAETSSPTLLPADEGMIFVRMNDATATASVEAYSSYYVSATYAGGPMAKEATVTIRHTGEVILTDKSGRSSRRLLDVETTGVSRNWLWGVNTMVPAAAREAIEKSLSLVSRQVIDRIVQMRRELATLGS
jgi:hypothetical protein